MGYWGDGHMNGGWGLAMVFGMLGLGLLIAVAVGIAVVWTARFACTLRPTRGATRRSSLDPPRRCAESPPKQSRSWLRAWLAARSTRRSTRLVSTLSGP